MSQSDDPDTAPAVDPTSEAYRYWATAFAFWNAELFEGALPKVMITLSRKSGAMGYYRARAMANRRGAVVGEIALNPQYFFLGDREAHATLVHEMVHLWRDVLGPPGRGGGRGSRGYHCTVWADKMEAVGLMPSSTGRPGGKRTGYRVSDYPLAGGHFERLFARFSAEHPPNPWWDHQGRRHGTAGSLEPALQALGVLGAGQTASGKRQGDRIKFSCSSCGQNAWAKPSAQLICGVCDCRMAAAI